MENRVNLGKAAPELYQSIVNLDRLASELAASAGIAEGLTHLLRLRASQLNQCAYCVRLHTRDALASGESSDRISVLPAWRLPAKQSRHTTYSAVFSSDNILSGYFVGVNQFINYSCRDERLIAKHEYDALKRRIAANKSLEADSNRRAHSLSPLSIRYYQDR